jgi:hypothetical protein
MAVAPVGCGFFPRGEGEGEGDPLGQRQLEEPVGVALRLETLSLPLPPVVLEVIMVADLERRWGGESGHGNTTW